MFMTGLLSGIGVHGTHPDQERDPPPAPTPILFPQHPHEPPSSRIWSEHSRPALQQIFSTLRGASDISPLHLHALNIRHTPPSPPDELLPWAPDGSSYLPPLTAEQAMTPSAYADAHRMGPRSAKRRKDFDERLAELQIVNDAAYRTINRTTKSGVKPPRIAWLRKFWEGLESMSQYWDTSLDQYYEGLPDHLPTQESVDKGRKRQKTGSTHTSSEVTVPIFATDPKPPPAIVNAAAVDEQLADKVREDAAETPLPATDDEPKNVSQHDDDSLSTPKSASPDPRSCLRYKGYRTASGRDMPDQFRTDTVRAFVEAACWAFECKVETPRQMPIVRMKHLNIPVRQTAQVYRIPKDRSKSRSGCLEGPMLTVQVRPETDFHPPSGQAHSATRARLDLMREIAGLLQCAQERRREGKVEVRPGEGKWYTTTPRWGGGPGGEVENDERSTDTLSKEVLGMAEEILGAAKAKAPNKSRRRKTPAMLWKELKPGSKTWDSKMDYQAIGREPDSPYDQVFMVSSLNHHISILKLTVHEAYLDFLETEQLPSPLPSAAGQAWCSPRLQRTQWYDLFSGDERVQAFRALWGVMAYLSRDVEKPTEAEASAGAYGVDGTEEDIVP